ncbi:MAG: aminoacyl-tRNA hydrolase [Gammaproteobacteria bacterium]|jgi:PTH2 family peptidyl-tRNA hydrolase
MTVDRIKQVILIRKDLKMRRGKEIAQGSHASMAFLVRHLHLEPDKNKPCKLTLSDVEYAWLLKGSAKVCLRVNSEQELLDYYQRCVDEGLQAHLIQDSGRTEFHGKPTYTACAIGPHYSSKIDRITGNLVPY